METGDESVSFFPYIENVDMVKLNYFHHKGRLNVV